MRALPSKNLYWVVTSCEMCGRRVRASHVLRYWSERKVPNLDDAEAMVTSSAGPAKIVNERAGLWTLLAAPGDYRTTYDLRAAVASFLEQVEQRLTAAARVAREGARRARYGRA